NSTKKKRHEPILDCTQAEVDRMIRFCKKGHWGIKEEFCFEALDSSAETLHTIALLEEIYYGRTPQKEIESAHLRENLRKELAQFKGYVRDYLEASGEDKQDLYLLIKQELNVRSAFTAFKRWLIWDNRAFLRELAILCG
ncbi:MAG: hypothetical protein K2L18_13075, partial [Acetatifactor sp.]|nr:hypothetical protein [Acetatifactor sp.]